MALKRSRSRRSGQEGYVLPISFVAILTNRLRASVGAGDCRRAKETAEFGFKAIIDSLNNDNNSCNAIDTNVTLPNDVTASYSMVAFEPAHNLQATATDCSMFGNLVGGQARITVRGRIARNGIEIARYDLVRMIHVQSNFSSDSNQLGLVITGPPNKSELGKPFFVLYDADDDGQIAWTEYVSGDLKLSGSGELTMTDGGNKPTESDFYGSLWTCIFHLGSGNTSSLVPRDAVDSPGPGLTGALSYRAYGAN